MRSETLSDPMREQPVDGDGVADALGSADGAVDGDEVGDAVGSGVGAVDGDEVGDAVGSDEGAVDGDEVGDVVVMRSETLWDPLWEQ